MLSDNVTRKPIHQAVSSMPVAVFVLPRQKVKPTSISPASIRIIQFIIRLVLSRAARNLGVSFQGICKFTKNYLTKKLAYRSCYSIPEKSTVMNGLVEIVGSPGISLPVVGQNVLLGEIIKIGDFLACEVQTV